MRLIFVYSIICFILFASFKVMAEDGARNVSALSVNNLLSDDVVKQPLSMSVFSAQGLNRQNTQKVQGTFTFSGRPELAKSQLTEHSAVYQFERRTRPAAFTERRKTLPTMTVAFVQFSNKIIPTNRQLQRTEHPHWDFIIGTGNIWQEANDNDFSRIAMPFSLVEKNQNCVHNGVLSFLINGEGKTSNFYYQISSETCLYYKVDLWGKGHVDYQSKQILNADDVIKHYRQEVSSRLPQLPIDDLTAQNATIQLAKIAMIEAINPTDMSNFGVIYNGKHYTSSCKTRYGEYPFCSQLVLPSYSTAKSIFAGISMLYLAKGFPTIFNEKVSDWIEECQGDNWQGVTFSHLLNMTTGNYHTTGHSSDEVAEHSQQFFKASTHQEKIHYSCQQFPRKSTPGSTFVYHTSDTYLLGAALNAFLRSQLFASEDTQKIDLFDIVFKQQLWPALKLSSIAYSTRKTSGNMQQPFTGYGLFFTQGDIAKISKFLMNEQTADSKFLDQTRLTDSLQRNQSNQDIHSQYPFIHYSNGFWKRNVTTLLLCEKETWLPYMLGYGGINIVLAKHNLQYYYFSDSNHYLWHNAIKELNKLTPLCRQ